MECHVGLRYVGQAFELSTRLPDDARDVDALVSAFHALYEERYTHADGGPVEAVCFRVSAYGVTDKPAPRAAGAGDGERRGSRGSRSTPTRPAGPLLPS